TGAHARTENARDHLEQRRLARAIAADDSQRLAGPHRDADVGQGLEMLPHHPTSEPFDGELLERGDALVRDDVTHRHVAHVDDQPRLHGHTRYAIRSDRRSKTHHPTIRTPSDHTAARRTVAPLGSTPE